MQRHISCLGDVFPNFSPTRTLYMAKKPTETTSKRVATLASKLLSNPKTPAAVKTVAASALTQKVKSKGK